MATNTFQNISHVTKEALMILHSNLSFTKNCDTTWSKEFAKKGKKIGATENIRQPLRIESAEDTVAFSGIEQDVTEYTTPLTINMRESVGLNFTALDMALEIDQFKKRYLEPTMAQLAAKVEKRVIQKAVEGCPNLVGTAGTTPSTFGTLVDAGTKLDLWMAPRGMNQRVACLNPLASGAIVKGDKSIFNPVGSISEQYKTGLIGDSGGFGIAMGQVIPTLTNGTGEVSGAPVINGGSQTGTTLNIDGVTASSTYKKGQVFTIAGVKAINYQTREAYGQLQQFVVTADATANGSGEVALSIYPAITPSGAYQTVSASPADGAALIFVGASSTSYVNNIACHKNAMAFASVVEELPKGSVEFAESASYDGITISLIKQFDIDTQSFKTRIDINFGASLVQPEHAVRLIGESTT